MLDLTTLTEYAAALWALVAALVAATTFATVRRQAAAWRRVVAGIAGGATAVALIAGPALHAADYGIRDVRVGLPLGFPLEIRELLHTRLDLVAPANVAPLAAVPVEVTLRNGSAYALPHDVALGFRWIDAEGRIAGGGSIPLERNVTPFEVRAVRLAIPAPAQRGAYTLDVDFVWPPQTPRWFHDLGGTQAEGKINVT